MASNYYNAASVLVYIAFFIILKTINLLLFCNKVTDHISDDSSFGHLYRTNGKCSGASSLPAGTAISTLCAYQKVVCNLLPNRSYSSIKDIV